MVLNLAGPIPPSYMMIWQYQVRSSFADIPKICITSQFSQATVGAGVGVEGLRASTPNDGETETLQFRAPSIRRLF